MKLDKVKTIIIKEKVKNPNVTVKELRETLLKKYGIRISLTRVARILQELKRSGAIREVIIPNENSLIFAFIEMSFNNHYFKKWKEAYEYLINSSHVVMFAVTGGVRRWKVLAAFRSFREVTLWIHEFLDRHGEFVDELNLMFVYDIYKFRFSPEIFESAPSEFLIS